MIVRFFRSDAMSERLGEVDDHVIEFPREFVQLTYNGLRDFDGETIAYFDHGIDAWFAGEPGREVAYSDVVIAGDDSPIGE
jgi:hypothetical protein